VKLHVLVDDLDTARVAIDGGATVVQWRLKDASTEMVVERGRATRGLCARHAVPFVVNDDIEAALLLGADGVHLGQNDTGRERAGESGLILGISVRTEHEAREAVAVGANYLGAGPVWATPSKADAAEPIGLEGLERLRDLPVPVVAIGGIDASNAADCIRSGASGVAVIRAARDAAALRRAIDEAF